MEEDEGFEEKFKYCVECPCCHNEYDFILAREANEKFREFKKTIKQLVKEEIARRKKKV